MIFKEIKFYGKVEIFLLVWLSVGRYSAKSVKQIQNLRQKIH